MKRIKLIFAIVLMMVIWFSKDVFWYSNFKNLYNSNINGKILFIRQGRGGKEFKIKSSEDYISLYSENDEYFEIGDSIHKSENSTEIKIFKRNNDTWKYFKSTFIQKDLDFYSLIVTEK
ncbi:hypothetical protein [Flavobacterium polysaccharolyticum]|uniref:DUF4178 domain-containing protein n=1 Tax=Flavobacterium polysaccharolyticum TaxID=3133148 RepID=A0ABU9NP74_9FLAO